MDIVPCFSRKAHCSTKTFARFVDDRISVFNQIWQVSEADSKLLLHEHSLPIPQEQRFFFIAVDESNGDY